MLNLSLVKILYFDSTSANPTFFFLFFGIFVLVYLLTVNYFLRFSHDPTTKDNGQFKFVWGQIKSKPPVRKWTAGSAALRGVVREVHYSIKTIVPPAHYQNHVSKHRQLYGFVSSLYMPRWFIRVVLEMNDSNHQGSLSGPNETQQRNKVPLRCYLLTHCTCITPIFYQQLPSYSLGSEISKSCLSFVRSGQIWFARQVTDVQSTSMFAELFCASS